MCVDNIGRTIPIHCLCCLAAQAVWSSKSFETRRDSVAVMWRNVQVEFVVRLFRRFPCGLLQELESENFPGLRASRYTRQERFQRKSRHRRTAEDRKV